MRICDRCGKKQIKKILQDKKEYTEFDFCDGCYDEFLLFLAAKEEKPECHAKKRENVVKKAIKVSTKQGGNSVKNK
jgi:hypothetical protein